MIVKYENRVETVFELKLGEYKDIKGIVILEEKRRQLILFGMNDNYTILSNNTRGYEYELNAFSPFDDIASYNLLPSKKYKMKDLYDDAILFKKYQKLFYFIGQKQKRIEIDSLNFSKKDMLSELLLHLSVLIDYEKIIPDYNLEDIISNLKYQTNKENQNFELFFDTDNLERCFVKDTTAEITGVINLYEYGDVDFSILIVNSKIEVVKLDIDQNVFEKKYLFVIEELKQLDIQYY